MPITQKQYNQQVSNCRGKTDRDGFPVEMKLTFAEWQEIWIDSGHAHQRGRGRGKYVMARFDDLGHYEKGNVMIVTHEENVAEASARQKGQTRKPHTAERNAKISASCMGRRSANKGKRLSEAHRAALSVSLTGNQNAAK